MTEDEERARSRIRRALGVAEPDGGLRSRVITSMPIDLGSGGSRWQWAAGGVAVTLVFAVVATLILVRHGGTTPHSASTGRLAGTLNMATQVGFRCSLPVAGYMTEARVSFPDGGVTVDNTVDPQQGKPYGFTYAGGKWLPVQASWVSPDGRFYAYTTTTSGVPGKQATLAVFVHEVATGKARQLWNGESGGQVVGWGPGGVYFNRLATGQTGPVSPELWVIDPANPAAGHRVGPNPPQSQASDPATPTKYGSFFKIAGGAAWGVTYVTPAAPSTSYVPGPSAIDRMDLRDGSVSTWYTAPDGKIVSIAGADAQGHPVLFLSVNVKAQAAAAAGAGVVPSAFLPPPPEVLLLTGPNQTRTIASGSDSAFRPNLALSDAHGTWFSSPGSLWLYRNGLLTKVADVPAELFPTPTPPPGATGKGSLVPGSPPPGYPTGVTLSLAGACT